MRILALGVPMPGPAVDNHSFASAPSFFDYDAIVVDPQALSQLIEEVASGGSGHTSRSGKRVVNVESGPETIRIADQLRDRRDETAQLLAHGGIVVCLAHPNVTHQAVFGMPDCDCYCWLPSGDGLRYGEPLLRRGDGARIEVAPVTHPFEPFLTRFAGRLAYRTYFGEAELPPSATVLARSAGGAAVAVEMCADKGHVVFLPPLAHSPDIDERYELSSALQHAIRQTLRLASRDAPPKWLLDYDLPGLTRPEPVTAEAPTELIEAPSAALLPLDHAQQLDQFRRLLWQEGCYGLEEAVRSSLALLGFTVTPAELDLPATVSITDDRLNQRAAMLEVDGSEEAVGLDGHYRLRQRIEDAIARGKPAQGLLMINGFRRTSPAERSLQYDDALRIAAERFRYCVSTTERLFHAVRATLEGDDATVAAYRERLFSTEGVLHDD
jgi:hypothetical protein